MWINLESASFSDYCWYQCELGDCVPNESTHSYVFAFIKFYLNEALDKTSEN